MGTIMIGLHVEDGVAKVEAVSSDSVTYPLGAASTTLFSTDEKQKAFYDFVVAAFIDDFEQKTGEIIEDKNIKVVKTTQREH